MRIHTHVYSTYVQWNICIITSWNIMEHTNTARLVSRNVYRNWKRLFFIYYFYFANTGFAKYNFFFGKCFKKILLNIFSNFLLYLKLQSFRLIMENNFIQMAASAGHAVAYTIGRIFKHITDCVEMYSTNGFTNIVP